MNLGAILHLNGKLKEAESNYLRALQLKPDDLITQSNLQKLWNVMQKQDLRTTGSWSTAGFWWYLRLLVVHQWTWLELSSNWSVDLQVKLFKVFFVEQQRLYNGSHWTEWIDSLILHKWRRVDLLPVTFWSWSLTGLIMKRLIFSDHYYLCLLLIYCQ